MNTSGMFQLNWLDFGKGLIVAALVGAVLAIIGAVSATGFDVFSADWLTIGRDFVNGGFAGLVGYLTKNFFTPAN